MLNPKSFVLSSSNRSPAPEMRLLINPKPVEPYGRRPRPGGALISTLPINVVTLLSPNSKFASPDVFSKKFGDQPKSTSKPTTLGFQPKVAPKSTRFSNSSSK